MMSPLVEWERVTKTYAGHVAVEALRSTSLSIDRGEYISIMGPSGSGKSTLLNVLGLLDTPTSGSYRLRGTETTDLPEQVRTALRSQVFGFVFQTFHLLPGRSVLTNVELGMTYAALDRREKRSRADEAIERVGLASLRNADPRRLSGGERQRVAIARALANQPELILCDEPTGQLDSQTADRILGLLDELNQSSLCVVVVTHDERVATSADRRINVLDGWVST